MREMRDLMGIEVIGVAEPRDAVGESELVVTSGPILLHPDPTMQAGWIRPGTFASAVDFDSSWSGAALAEFDKVATDDYQQFHYYREHGYFAKTPDPYADRGGRAPWTRAPGRADHRDQPRDRPGWHGPGARNHPPRHRTRDRHVAAALT